MLGIILDHRLVQCSSCSFPSESEKFSVNYDRHSDVIVKVEKGFVDDRYQRENLASRIFHLILSIYYKEMS